VTDVDNPLTCCNGHSQDENGPGNTGVSINIVNQTTQCAFQRPDGEANEGHAGCGKGNEAAETIDVDARYEVC